MKQTTMKIEELRRLTFCNSDELLGRVFVIDGVAHEWIGIGMVECDDEPDWAIGRVIVEY